MLTKHIAIVIYEGVQALDIAGPADVFAEANRFLASDRKYQIRTVANSYEPLRSSSGMQLVADINFTTAEHLHFDVLLVAGSPDLLCVHSNDELIDWVRAAATRAACYGAICTGAFVLGHAGLLDGHHVTTHWEHTKLLQSLFPAAVVVPDAIHVQDGRLITSAGVTAGIDLALALVREDHGALLASKVAKQLVVVLQRTGGQSQFSPFLEAPVDDSSVVSRVQQRIMTNLSKRHSLRTLAQELGISTRTLSRHFQRETGASVHELIMRIRLESARRLLETSDKPLKTVAFECGFASSDRMRQVFIESIGVTPAHYRASFKVVR